jgi:hypothetical protein
MGANLVNVVLGIALVYVAVLQPSLTSNRPGLLLAVATLIFVAAWLARRSDHHPWQNNTNMLLAVLLAAVGALRLEHLPLATFWSQFSIGTVVAVLALWAALYRPAAPQT